MLRQGLIGRISVTGYSWGKGSKNGLKWYPWTVPQRVAPLDLATKGGRRKRKLKNVQRIAGVVDPWR